VVIPCGLSGHYAARVAMVEREHGSEPAPNHPQQGVEKAALTWGNPTKRKNAMRIHALIVSKAI